MASVAALPSPGIRYVLTRRPSIMSTRRELVLPPRCWLQQLPEVALRGGPGLAYLTRNFTPASRQWVAGDIRPAGRPLRGRDLGPLEDLLLVRIEEAVVTGAGDRLIAEFEPLPSQQVIALVLGR